MILSCVRAPSEGSASTNTTTNNSSSSSNNHTLGFVSDWRRLNVAVTRAKFSMWIIGHAKTLQAHSDDWSQLIDDARRRAGCYVEADPADSPPRQHGWGDAPQRQRQKQQQQQHQRQQHQRQQQQRQQQQQQ
eukprot:1361-Heterococcus_DN1.PRE.1